MLAVLCVLCTEKPKALNCRWVWWAPRLLYAINCHSINRRLRVSNIILIKFVSNIYCNRDILCCQSGSFCVYVRIKYSLEWVCNNGFITMFVQRLDVLVVHLNGTLFIVFFYFLRAPKQFTYYLLSSIILSIPFNK